MSFSAGDGVVVINQEWERSHDLFKARQLYDIHHHHHHHTYTTTTGTSKRARVDPSFLPPPLLPSYLNNRVVEGGELPKVVVGGKEEEKGLVEWVVEYVVCGGLQGELFVELMKLMGKTGFR